MPSCRGTIPTRPRTRRTATRGAGASCARSLALLFLLRVRTDPLTSPAATPTRTTSQASHHRSRPCSTTLEATTRRRRGRTAGSSSSCRRPTGATRRCTSPTPLTMRASLSLFLRVDGSPEPLLTRFDLQLGPHPLLARHHPQLVHRPVRPLDRQQARRRQARVVAVHGQPQRALPVQGRRRARPLRRRGSCAVSRRGEGARRRRAGGIERWTRRRDGRW